MPVNNFHFLKLKYQISQKGDLQVVKTSNIWVNNELYLGIENFNYTAVIILKICIFYKYFVERYDSIFINLK